MPDNIKIIEDFFLNALQNSLNEMALDSKDEAVSVLQKKFILRSKIINNSSRFKVLKSKKKKWDKIDSILGYNNFKRQSGGEIDMRRHQTGGTISSKNVPYMNIPLDITRGGSERGRVKNKFKIKNIEKLYFESKAGKISKLKPYFINTPKFKGYFANIDGKNELVQILVKRKRIKANKWWDEVYNQSSKFDIDRSMSNFINQRKNEIINSITENINVII